MSAPNLSNVSSILFKVATVIPANTSDNVLLSNAASSGRVYRIHSILACNIDGSTTYAASLAYCAAAAGSGTQTRLADRVDVPAKSTMILIDHFTPVFLEEDRSLVVKSSTASKIEYIVSYSDMG